MAILAREATDESVPSALIASAAAGDATAFASIVRAHHEDMRRVCVVVAGDELIAEDGGRQGSVAGGRLFLLVLVDDLLRDVRGHFLVMVERRREHAAPAGE
jgi:hypothetical protein